jgi:anaerobic C4-dicarboxylate transporter
LVVLLVVLFGCGVRWFGFVAGIDPTDNRVGVMIYVFAVISALMFGYSLGSLFAYKWLRREPKSQVVTAIANEHARFVVGMLVSLQSIEQADDPVTEARHTRELLELTIVNDAS